MPEAAQGHTARPELCWVAMGDSHGSVLCLCLGLGSALQGQFSRGPPSPSSLSAGDTVWRSSWLPGIASTCPMYRDEESGGGRRKTQIALDSHGPGLEVSWKLL